LQRLKASFKVAGTLGKLLILLWATTAYERRTTETRAEKKEKGQGGDREMEEL